MKVLVLLAAVCCTVLSQGSTFGGFRPTFGHAAGGFQPANYNPDFRAIFDDPAVGILRANSNPEILRSCAPNNCGCRTDRDCHYMLDGYFGAYSKCCDVRYGDEYILGFHKLCRKKARGQACAKQGLCPDDSREPGHCSKQPDTCALDIDCPLAQKCCPDDCLGQTCKDPQFLRFNP